MDNNKSYSNRKYTLLNLHFAKLVSEAIESMQLLPWFNVLYHYTTAQEKSTLKMSVKVSKQQKVLQTRNLHFASHS